jgi:excisionase family DNA binding protein
MAEPPVHILAHKEERTGEHEGATAYEDVNSAFDAERLVLQPLCAGRLAPEKIVPAVRLSAARARTIFVVPLLEKKLVADCPSTWIGTHACARCVCDRWSEILGGDPAFEGGVALDRMQAAEALDGKDAALVRVVRSHEPAFSFATRSFLACAAASFGLSGTPAALAIGDRLFVQIRGRTASADDIAALFAAKWPQPEESPTEETPLLADDALYDVEWVARYLGVKPGTINNWISQGSIPCTKVGGKSRFMGRVLRDWLRSTTSAGGAGDAEGDAPITRFPWDTQ